MSLALLTTGLVSHQLILTEILNKVDYLLFAIYDKLFEYFLDKFKYWLGFNKKLSAAFSAHSVRATASEP